MLKAGWNAHKLNAPGKFLVSAPEHDTPRRARAYLAHRRRRDPQAAARYAARPPATRDAVLHAAALASTSQPRNVDNIDPDETPETRQDDPEAILRDALSAAPA